MNRGSMKGKLLASAIAFAMGPAAFGITYLGTQLEARADVKKVACRVHEVLAAKEGDGKIPKNLEFLRAQLEDDAFAAYKGFFLLETKTATLELEKLGTAKFGSGHQAELRLLGGDDKRLKLGLTLLDSDGKTKLVGTEYSIEDNGLLMIQAGKHKSQEVEGKLFFAVQCARRG